jgi:signal peptidase I
MDGIRNNPLREGHVQEDRIADAKRPRETAVEGLASTCSVLVIGLFVLTFVFQNFVIPSSSMASTLLVGDHVVVERMALAPAANWAPFVHYREVQRGDIIVFYKPTAQSNRDHIFLVKRVIGIPGDHVHLRAGIVYLNGIAQNEPQAAKPTSADYPSHVDDFPSISPSRQAGVTAEWSLDLPTHIQSGDLVVPSGSYFAMGDNRDNSLDSRYWGFVPRANIVGRPLFVYWSIRMPETGADEAPLSERAGTTLHEFVHFFDETRWTRTLHRIQ